MTENNIPVPPRNRNEIVFVNPEDGSKLTRGEIHDELKATIEHVIESLTQAVEAGENTSDPNIVGPEVSHGAMHLITEVLPELGALAKHDSEQATIQARIQQYADSVHVDVPDFIPSDWDQ